MALLDWLGIWSFIVMPHKLAHITKKKKNDQHYTSTPHTLATSHGTCQTPIKKPCEFQHDAGRSRWYNRVRHNLEEQLS